LRTLFGKFSSNLFLARIAVRLLLLVVYYSYMLGYGLVFPEGILCHCLCSVSGLQGNCFCLLICSGL